MSENSNLEELLKNFKAKFINKNNSNIGDSSVSRNPFKVDLNKYTQPKIGKETQKKIIKLVENTEYIEQKILSKNELNIPNKKFKINYEKELNESQLIATTSIEGSLLVIAGAGSGKTRTLTYRLAYMLENEIDPQNILLMTFTRKAANEMIERATKLLDGKNINITSGTFHSFSNFVLRKYYRILNLLPNFTIADMVDSEDIIDLIRQELKFNKKDKAFPKKGRIQEIISKSRNCNRSIDNIIDSLYRGLKDYKEEIKLLAETFKEYKKSNNILDYDDLMEILRDSLRDNKEFREIIQERYKYIMVDEFQDTNPIQKEITDYIAEKYKNIMVVGDDSQSIYGFRGAEVENILRFPEVYPDCKVIKIEKNYRSSQEILNFTNDIIRNIKIGYKKELFSDNSKLVKPNIQKFFSQQDEAKFIVDKILELRESNIPLKNISVLYRASYHSSFIQAELTKRNIPYVVFGGVKFTERRHVKDIISYLRVIFNPYDSVSWNRILKLVPGVGSVASSSIINNIVENQGMPDLSKFKGKKFYQDLEKLIVHLLQSSQEEISIPQKIEILSDYYLPILKTIDDDYEIRILDLDVIKALATKYSSIEKFLSDFALDPPSSRMQDNTVPMIDESEDGYITLSTIHSAKGLEWHSVFVPHLLDGVFPGAISLSKFEDLEEERRLFYVACTRAKEKLFLTMPSEFTSWDSIFTLPSRFISEIDESNYVINVQ